MADFYTGQKDTLTHSAIVHDLLKKIVVELGTREFKGGYTKPVLRDGMTYIDYVADSRAEYIQAVESLADVLLPQYDDKMTKEYTVYETALAKIEKLLEDKDVRMGDATHSKFIKAKLLLVRKLFRELNLLLKRTNYLKAAAYSEDDLDDITDVDDDAYEE